MRQGIVIEFCVFGGDRLLNRVIKTQYAESFVEVGLGVGRGQRRVFYLGRQGGVGEMIIQLGLKEDFFKKGESVLGEGRVCVEVQRWENVWYSCVVVMGFVIEFNFFSVLILFLLYRYFKKGFFLVLSVLFVGLQGGSRKLLGNVFVLFLCQVLLRQWGWLRRNSFLGWVVQ